MKKILISSILFSSLLFSGEYDPFDYNFKRPIKENKSMLENLNTFNNLEITKNNLNQNDTNLELTVTKYNKDEKKDSLNEIELTKERINDLSSLKKTKEKPITESVDSLLDKIKFTQEEKQQIVEKEFIKELNTLPTKKEEKKVESNDQIKDIKPVLVENESYILLYETKSFKGIKNKLLINDIKNAFILKSKKNNNYGIFVNSKEYNINKISLLYKEQKEFKYEDINTNYDLFKNYLNN